MNQPENREATLRRVQKLLAIAGDTRANANEAAAAAQQAERIMRKYQWEHADVLGAQLSGSANGNRGMATRQVHANRRQFGKIKTKVVPPWTSWLAVRIAQFNDCLVAYAHHPDWGRCLEFKGHEDDVQLAEWTFDYLVNALEASIRQFQREAPRTKTASSSYRTGFALALCDNLAAAKRAKDAEVAAQSTSRSLMVLKMAVVTEHFGKEKYSKVKNTSTSDASGYARGRSDGARVNVTTRAVGHTASTSPRRLAA